MKQDSPIDPDVWGDDPISREISSQIACMPDCPPIVIALINYKDEKDQEIRSSLSSHQEAFLSVHPIKVFGKPLRIYYLGFHKDTTVAAFEFLRTLAETHFDEAVIYSDGAHSIRLSKTKIKDSSEEDRHV